MWNVDHESPRIKTCYLVDQLTIPRDDNTDIIDAALNIDRGQGLRRASSMLDCIPESTFGMSVEAPIDGMAIGALSTPTAESTRTNTVVVMVSLGFILRPLSGEGA